MVVVFSLVFAIIERSEMGLYEVPRFLSLLGLGTGIMFANFHVCEMVLLFNSILYMLVMHANQSGPMCS